MVSIPSVSDTQRNGASVAILSWFFATPCRRNRPAPFFSRVARQKSQYMTPVFCSRHHLLGVESRRSSRWPLSRTTHLHPATYLDERHGATVRPDPRNATGPN